LSYNVGIDTKTSVKRHKERSTKDMAQITKDYRITIVDPDGIVIEEISLLEYDLDKSVARASIMNDIQEAIIKAETGS